MFEFEPYFVIVSPQIAFTTEPTSNGTIWGCVPWFYNTTKSFSAISMRNTLVLGMNLTWDNNTLKWWNSESYVLSQAKAQLNVKNNNYYYVAIA